jgi:hypothetical protein
MWKCYTTLHAWPVFYACLFYLAFLGSLVCLSVFVDSVVLLLW